jgi:hypothetical protein
MAEKQAIPVPCAPALLAGARGFTRQDCVILTLVSHFPTKNPRFAPWSSGRENQRCYDAARGPWTIPMQKEATPMWVWLSVALLAIGTAGYVTSVYLLEYMMTFF